MIRVLVAEDSPTVRELLVAILESDPELTVIGHARSGQEAVELAAQLRPDLITMDVHMPLMDGLQATREIMIRTPTPILIVSSTADQRQIELSLDATRAGALMVVATPDAPGSERFEEQREHLVKMVKAMAEVRVVRRWRTGARKLPPSAPRDLLAPGAGVRLVAMAASTGGPAALQRILSDLPPDFPAPVLVVQHIAPGFLEGLCGWLGTNCNLRIKLAEAGEPAAARTVYLAPDDRHLGVRKDGCLLLSDAPPVGGFRPSANVLFAAAADAYGAGVAAVILTGMGKDGVEGLRAVHAAGGRVLAQDRASSVVYGMPEEAVHAGVVDDVLPVREIAGRLMALVQGGRLAAPDPGR